MKRQTGVRAIASSGFAVALALSLSGPILAQEATPPAGSPVAGMEAADAILRDAAGSDVGSAMLTNVVEDGVQVSVYVDAGVLEPGEHGIHIHERGACETDGDQPFASAGGHYNPTDDQHGAPGDPQAHVGDLGNITVVEGEAVAQAIPTDRFQLADLNDADGSALMIHADRDNLETDPSGSSGQPVLCAVIFPPQDENGGVVEGTPIAEAIQTGLATALPNVDEPQPDSDEAPSPEPTG